MNKVILMGRLAREPEVRYSQGGEPIAVARYTLAVNRRFKRKDELEADFIPCVAFGKAAVRVYWRKGGEGYGNKKHGNKGYFIAAAHKGRAFAG